MKAPSRRRILLAAVASLLSSAGCGAGGGVPASGSQAVLPPNYKEKEKEIADGFKAMMKNKSARPKAR